jgi:predicted RNase H-like HicB family nuclease
MKPAHQLTAIIQREDDGFAALFPELDVASKGASVEEARANLIEALTRSLKRLPHPRSRDALTPKCS